MGVISGIAAWVVSLMGGAVVAWFALVSDSMLLHGVVAIALPLFLMLVLLACRTRAAAHPYTARALTLWLIWDMVAMVVALILVVVLVQASPFFLMSVIGITIGLHMVFAPAYRQRRHLGHPAWVLLPAITATITTASLVRYFAPDYFYNGLGHIVCFAAGAVIVIPLTLFRPTRFKVTLATVWVVGICLLFAGQLQASRFTFMRDLYRIEPGMSAEAVEGIMGEYLKGSGFPPVPGAEKDEDTTVTDIATGVVIDIDEKEAAESGAPHTRIYRHSNKAQYNADWGVVKFDASGRVAEVYFSPD